MNFTWIAEDYLQNSQFQYEHAQLAISRYRFIGNESVLDVGCGDGRITSELASKLKYGSVVGIDSSPSMIKFASKVSSGDKYNLSFLVGNAENINYHEKFDVVVSFACLHWVQDQLRFLTGAKNALKKNGTIIITLYPKHPFIWEAIEETANNPFWRKYFYGYENPHICYDVRRYEELSLEAGLSIKHLKEQEPVAYFKSKGDMGAFLRSWLPHTNQIETKLREEFLNDIAELFFKKANIKNQKLIGMPFRRLDAVLIKK